MRIAVLFCILASVQGLRNPRKARQKKVSKATNTKHANAISYSLDHSLDNGQSFQSRGKFELRSYNTRNGTKWKVSFDEPGKLFANEPSKFENLIKARSYYRVRASVTDSAASVDHVVAFIPACALLESKFKEYFMLRIDDFGHIMAIEYANSVQQQECSGKQLPTEIKFRPKAVVVPATEAPSLPVTIVGNIFFKEGQQAAVTGVNTPGNGKGQQPQQQTFFQKYVR